MDHLPPSPSLSIPCDTIECISRMIRRWLYEQKANKEILKALASFPLLKHQWPLVESFHTQIVRQSEARLATMDLCLADFISAITSLVLTTKLSLIDALNKFFQLRLQYLLDLCKEECEKPSDTKV